MVLKKQMFYKKQKYPAAVIPGVHLSLWAEAATKFSVVFPEHLISSLTQLADCERKPVQVLFFSGMEILLDLYKGLNSSYTDSTISFRDIIRRDSASLAPINNFGNSADTPYLTVNWIPEASQIKALDAATQLSLTLFSRDHKVEGLWQWREGAFELRYATRTHQHFITLLESMAAKPDQHLAGFSLLTSTERQQILYDWNNTQTSYPRHSTIHELFAEQAARTPDATAVLDGATALSYAALNEKANQLARYLQKCGAGSASPVGLAIHRSASLVVAMLAVLKTGGYYLPLDTAYPIERIRLMVQENQPVAILSDRHNASRLADAGAPIILFDNAFNNHFEKSSGTLNDKATADSLAYVMYTSGSTGVPKGSLITHRGIIRLVKNTNYVSLTAEDVFGQIANASFDAITFEIWGALLNGAKLVIIPNDVVISPDKFTNAIHHHGITTMFLTSALFNVMAAARPAAFGNMRYLIVGGDAVDPGSARKVLAAAPPLHLINGYGPTECTTFSVTHPIQKIPDDAISIPIGRPIANSEAYILNSCLQPVPVGVTGELYLGGDGVARGYLNRPELTGERFIPHPFNSDPTALLYKTGDKARYCEDGSIEFLGRTDHQIKLRGFRIELGEIETTLRQHPKVADAVVVLRELSHNERHLVAYAAVSALDISQAELRHYLQERLPEFMIPATIVVMTSLPLTPAGKVDRNALPTPQLKNPVFVEQPVTNLQKEIAAVLEKLLQGTQVGLDDNFFDLGATSLTLAMLETELTVRISGDVQVTDFFQYPTIRTLAAHLTRAPETPAWADTAQQRARNQAAARAKQRQRLALTSVKS